MWLGPATDTVGVVVISRWTKPRYRRCDHASADTEGQGGHALASSVRQQLPQAATTNSTASHRGWCRRAPTPTPTHLTPSRYAALVISSSCCCTLPVNALTPESGTAPGGRDMMKSIGLCAAVPARGTGLCAAGVKAGRPMFCCLPFLGRLILTCPSLLRVSS